VYSAKEFQSANLKGSVNFFSEVGDILAMHKHGPNESHISIVAEGSLISRQPGAEPVLYTVGTVIDWDFGAEHEWECAQAPAKLVNITKWR